MDSRPGWIEGTDDPAIAVIASNNVSRMARRADQITEEVTRIKQRVDRMIQTFERTHNSIYSNKQNPDMEILEDMDELENVLHDQDQKRKYQQKLTVFIVGYQETCGQRRHLLTQLQEFFSLYSNIGGEEGDHQPRQANLDLDGIAYQVTGAVRSAEAAMSRLADIHTGIMNYMSQTISAGTQGKWGRKKLEKVLEQTRLDIVQLTDQLLQAKEDLTLKDQQMKELQKQNELRMLEIQHFKSQLQVTKRSLQSLQDETATQRSLLEAELRRQAGRLEELGSRNAVRREQQTDASTQWEVLDFMFKDGERDITAISEGKQNILKDSMEITAKTSPTELSDEQSDMPNLEMQFNAIDSGTEKAPQPDSLESFTVYEENIPDIPGSPVVGEYDAVITSASVEEECNTILSSLPPSENSNHSVTPPPDDLSALQLWGVSELEIHHRDNDHPEMFPPSSAEAKERMKLVLTPCVSQNNMTSPEDKLNHLILPAVTEEKDQSAHSVSGEIPESNLSLPLSNSESDVTASCHQPDMETHFILSAPISEKFSIPITAFHLTHEGVQCSQPDSSDTLFQVSEKNITLLIPDEDTNPRTSIPVTNKETHLMISPSNIKENPDFHPVSIMEKIIHISLPADNTLEALSPLYEHNDLTHPISDHNAQCNLSVPVPDMATLPLTSLPELDETTELITSLSIPSDSMHPLKALPLNSENSNMDDSVPISLNVPDHTASDNIQPPETHEEQVTANDNEESLISSSIASIDQAAEAAVLCDVQAGRKTEWISYLEEVSAVKSLDCDNQHAQLLPVSQRLHRCVQGIRDLLVTEGFQSLADCLTEGTQDSSGDGISGNLTQLENFLAVLHGLLHNTQKQLSDEHLQDADITNGNKRSEKNRPLLLTHAENGAQTSADLPMDSPLSHDSGSIPSMVFTRLDEEHNRRVLQRARYQGRIPIHLYKDASRVMSAYSMMRQERLRALVWGYVIYIAWKRAENLLQKQCVLKPLVTPTLSKLQKMKDQVFLRWRGKMMQSQEERISLSAALHQTLQGVQEESGIFLIKPILSWSASSSVMETRKQSRLRCKALLQPALPSLNQNRSLMRTSPIIAPVLIR